MNATDGSLPVLPANLYRNLHHIQFRVGGSHDDNTVTDLILIIDTGAGCTIDWMNFFEAVYLNNQSILVKIYTCIGGNYSPTTMHGMVDTAAGIITTELPVAFENMKT